MTERAHTKTVRAYCNTFCQEELIEEDAEALLKASYCPKVLGLVVRGLIRRAYFRGFRAAEKHHGITGAGYE